MSTRALPRRLAAALLLALAIVRPAAAADADAVRSRIDDERRAAQTRYDAALVECESRFARTACEDKAREQLRSVSQRLDAERAALDDAERRARAADRHAAVAQRARERAAEAAPAAASARPATTRKSGPAPAPLFGARPAAAASAVARVDAEALARWNERQQRAREHEEAIRRRNAELAARKPPAAGLPLPAASAPR